MACVTGLLNSTAMGVLDGLRRGECPFRSCSGLRKRLRAMGIRRKSMYDKFGDKHALHLEAFRHSVAERLATQIRLLNAEPSPGVGIHAGHACQHRLGDGGLSRHWHSGLAGPLCLSASIKELLHDGEDESFLRDRLLPHWSTDRRECFERDTRGNRVSWTSSASTTTTAPMLR